MVINSQKDIIEIMQAASDLVYRAQAKGVVLSIQQRPLTPLAMGNHQTTIEVRASRNSLLYAERMK